MRSNTQTDPAPLGSADILTRLLNGSDENYFKPSNRTSPQLPENWVLRLASLKRLFRLISQYFTEVLNQPSSGLDVPNLQAIAQDYDLAQTMAVCRLVLAIAVQSDKKQEVVQHIQKLSERDQHALMKPIEVVSPDLTTATKFLLGHLCEQFVLVRS